LISSIVEFVIRKTNTLRNIEECLVGGVQERSFGENGADVVNHAQIVSQFFGHSQAKETKGDVNSRLNIAG
jgi:hypothetical protein